MTATRQITRTTAGRTSAGAMLLVFFALSASWLADVAEAKTPGRSYCFLGRCHRVLTLAETRARLGRTETLRASFYDHCARDRFNPCTLTSSGEIFRPGSPDNAASPIYPDGTMLLLFHQETGAAAVVRVNNAGPYHSSRLIDVSAATADALGFRTKGLADLEVRVIAAPRAEEAAYRRQRRYWPVHGPIGTHASIAEAHEALVRVSELPRVPARADAAQLVAHPMIEVAATPPASDIEFSALTQPGLIDPAVLPVPAIASAPLAPADWLQATVAPPGEVMALAVGYGGVATVAATDASLDLLAARDASIWGGEPGLLATLRARARQGLKPSSLPDVRFDVAMTWVRETAWSVAAHARSAARSRIAPRRPERLASLSVTEREPPDRGSISRR